MPKLDIIQTSHVFQGLSTEQVHRVALFQGRKSMKQDSPSSDKVTVAKAFMSWRRAKSFWRWESALAQSTVGRHRQPSLSSPKVRSSAGQR